MSKIKNPLSSRLELGDKADRFDRSTAELAAEERFKSVLSIIEDEKVKLLDGILEKYTN